MRSFVPVQSLYAAMRMDHSLRLHPFYLLQRSVRGPCPIEIQGKSVLIFASNAAF